MNVSREDYEKALEAVRVQSRKMAETYRRMNDALVEANKNIRELAEILKPLREDSAD